MDIANRFYGTRSLRPSGPGLRARQRWLERARRPDPNRCIVIASSFQIGETFAVPRTGPVGLPNSLCNRSSTARGGHDRAALD